MSRADGRSARQLRALNLALDSAPYAEGSCLIQRGPDAGPVRRVGAGRRSRMAGEERRRLGDGGVRHASQIHTHTVGPGAG